MPTGSILLPIGAAVQPDGSASNLAPAVQRVKSSATAPSPYFMQAMFDAAALEQMMWSFRVPADYGSSPVLKVQYKMTSATSGNVIILGRLAAVTDGDAIDVDAKAFGASNSATVTVPGTVGHIDEASLALTSDDSMASADFAVVYVARDGASGSDTATGDMEVVSVSVTYTTA